MPAIQKSNVLRLSEGDRLPANVQARDWVRLRRATRHLHDAFREVESGQALQIGNVVGFIDLGDLRLEILPKASAVAGSKGDPGEFLLDLLVAAGAMPRTRLEAGDVHRTRSLLEGLLKAFADDLAERLDQGIPRRYHEVAEDSPVVRGRIDFCRLALRPPGRDHLLPVRHAPLQFDNPLSQVILATVNRLLGLVRSVRTASVLQHCTVLLDRVTPGQLTVERVQRLHLSPMESAWKPVIDFAAALARGYLPDPVSGGAVSSFSLTFSLDDLFEAVLRKLLPTVLLGSTLSLRAARSRSPLLRSVVTGAEVLNLKPDYLFQSADRTTQELLVADAKWKRLDPNKASFGLSPSDVYQVTTYMAYYGLNRGVLLFPTDEWMPAGSDAWSHRFDLIDNARNKRITLVGVDIADLVSRDQERRARGAKRLRQAVLDAL